MTKDKRAGIYMIFNLVNWKRYIGQSQNVRIRWWDHRQRLRRGDHYNLHMQRAWDTYGENSFEFRVLEETPEDVRDERERAWIAFYRSADPEHGYNSESGGVLNRTFSQETRDKIAAAHRGMKMPETTRAAIRRANLGSHRPPSPESVEKRRRKAIGRKASPETRRKMSLAHSGRKHTAASREKMSQAQRGRTVTLETRAKMSVSAKRRWGYAACRKPVDSA